MSFPSHLHGLNLFPSAGVYDDTPTVSDEELARTLALWTNVDFSFDDGGIGAGSAQKLLDEDALAASSSLTQTAAAVQQPSWGQQSSTAAPSDADLDPFGFNTALFELATAQHQQNQQQQHIAASVVSPAAPSAVDERHPNPLKRKAPRSSSVSSESSPAGPTVVKQEESGESLSHEDE